jgi:uncharacterized membrane protein
MAKNHRQFIGLALLLVLLAGSAIFILAPRLFQSESGPIDSVSDLRFGADTVRAKVLDILEEGQITLGDQTQAYQILLVKLLEGPHTGQLIEIDYGQRQIRPEGLKIRVGDTVLVTVGQGPDGTLTAYFTDFVRTRPILILFATFVVASILISGWKGVRGLIAMLISLVIIIGFIIPQILNGKDPVVISIIGSFILLSVTLYLTYGWNLKTHAAVLGTLTALILTGFLASFFVNLTSLTGFGSEDALFLIQQTDFKINLRGLVLGGMLIGALGVLDDLVITQASAVFEIYLADSTQDFGKLFRSAMRIGQDHVAATINTLVLAYAGAALPTLLLFSLSGEQYSFLINLEFVTEEIVRTLVGSLGLIAAVPITTALASMFAVYHDRLSKLGSMISGNDQPHHH